MTSASDPITALVVPVPDAEAAVGPWRLRHDPSAVRGMPAHVTVLYPFVRLDQLGEAGIYELRTLFCRIPAPELEFRGFGTFEDVLWLAPRDPSSIITLTELVVKRWPEAPPYGGLYPTVVPHLTIAAGPGAEHLSHVRRDVTRHLPIRSRPCDVHLLELRDRWRTVERFSFRR